jgi:D-lactate dehydrogenase (cytochrome)
MTREICMEQACSQFEPGLGRGERDRMFKARHALGEMVVRNHPGCNVLIVDVAVPITAYPELTAYIRQETAAKNLVSYFFSHAGNGNVHLNIVGKKDDQNEWDTIHQVVQQVVSLSLKLGGTATGEHGVGLGKRKFMVAEHGSGLEWMKRVKSLFDPNGILNPDKIWA